MVYVAVLLMVLVGCHQPENYAKNIEKLKITSRLTDLEAQINDFSQTLEAYLNDITNEQVNNDIINELDAIKTLFAEINRDCESLDPKDEHLIDANRNLKEALVNYETLINNMASLYNVTYDLDRYIDEIQTLNQQLFDVSFSGEPASEQYKEALGEFMNSNTLELMYVSNVEALLRGTSINKEQLKTYLSNASISKDNLMLITTYNKSDEKIHHLIITIYEKIIEMFNYVLENIEIIEWINGYHSFDDYYQEQTKIINEYLSKWQSVLP